MEKGSRECEITNINSHIPYKKQLMFKYLLIKKYQYRNINVKYGSITLQSAERDEGICF